MKLEFSRQMFEKSSRIKFYKNLSSGSRVIPCGRTDITKPVVAFRNFANAPKNNVGNILWRVCCITVFDVKFWDTFPPKTQFYYTL
jgi:hypothetical protein